MDWDWAAQVHNESSPNSLERSVAQGDNGHMEGLYLAANAKGIPYDVWWAIWAIFAFLLGPALIAAVVTKRRPGSRHAIIVILPVPLLLGLAFLSIASSCHSLGVYAPRGCNASAATWDGWISIGLATAVYIGVGIAMSRPDPWPSDNVNRDAYRQ